MVKDRQLARMISERILEANHLLNEAVALVEEHGSINEAKDFRVAIGQVSGELLLAVANPLYKEHPELKPLGLFIPGV